MSYVGFIFRGLSLLGAFTAASSVYAGPTFLSEVSLFARCYTQMTGERPKLSNALRRAVQNGSVSGMDACLSLLDRVQFGNDGKLTDASDPEARRVLNHLNDFHRSWFQSDNFDAAVPDRDQDLIRDREMHDETEPALHVTRALFGNKVPYSEVVTGNSSLEALRSSGRTFEMTWDGTKGYLTDGATNQFQKFRGLSRGVSKSAACFPSGSCYEDYMALGPYEFVMDAELTQTGELEGVRETNADKLRMETHSSVGASLSVSPYAAAVYFNDKIKVHESLGGGFLGTIPYLILNLGRPYSTFADGGLDLARRWSKAVLVESLCRDTPPIRSSDAIAYVNSASTIPFRKNFTCMQCHASLDPLAGVARGVSIRPTPNYSGQSQRGLASTQLAVHPVLEPAETAIPDMDGKFFKRPPNGKLFYRSFDGQKVDLPIDGSGGSKGAFAALGSAIASTDDFYVCAASRYYQFFTGIKVSLQDIGDPAILPLSDRDKIYRNEVIALGKKLKTHQSLKTLIEDILKLERYRSTSPRGEN